jgi:hypothetical protein
MRRKIIAELEEMERFRDDDDVARDQLWYSLNHRWAFRLEQVLNAGTNRSSDSTYVSCQVARRRSNCSERLLQLDLALWAYRAEHGAYPQSLEALQPRYLSEIPLDPFSRRAFVFRPMADDFVLYSVGGDGVDNGGKFGRDQYTAALWDGYDLDLDTPRW